MHACRGCASDAPVGACLRCRRDQRPARCRSVARRRRFQPVGMCARTLRSRSTNKRASVLLPPPAPSNKHPRVICTRQAAQRTQPKLISSRTNTRFAIDSRRVRRDRVLASCRTCTRARESRTSILSPPAVFPHSHALTHTHSPAVTIVAPYNRSAAIAADCPPNGH